MQEIRRHRRLEGPVFVDYHVLDGNGLSGCTPATNISEGGVRFTMPQAVALQTPMQLQLHVGRLGASPAVVEGHVVWVRQHHDAGEPGYVVGVAFNHPSSRFMQRLLARVYASWEQLRRAEQDS